MAGTWLYITCGLAGKEMTIRRASIRNLFHPPVSYLQEANLLRLATAHANRRLHVHLHYSHILSYGNWRSVSTTMYYKKSSLFIMIFQLIEGSVSLKFIFYDLAAFERLRRFGWGISPGLTEQG